MTREKTIPTGSTKPWPRELNNYIPWEPPTEKANWVFIWDLRGKIMEALLLEVITTEKQPVLTSTGNLSRI